MQVIVNGESRLLTKECTLAEALLEWGYKMDMPIAVAVDNQVIPKQNHANLMLAVGNTSKFSYPCKEVNMTWELAGKIMTSRLLLGTARYPSLKMLEEAINASRTDVITIALRLQAAHK